MKAILAAACIGLLLAIPGWAQGDVRAEFNQRLAAIDQSDVVQLLELAEWADEKRLKASAARLYQKVLAIEADNETAHKALGHRLVNGQWMTKKEYRDWRKKQSQGGAKGAKKATARSGRKDPSPAAEVVLRPVDIEPALAASAKADRTEEAEVRDALGTESVAMSSQHFALRTQFTREETKKYLVYSEQVYQALCEVFGQPLDQPVWNGKSTFYIFKDEASYYDASAFLGKKWAPLFPGASSMRQHRQWHCTGCIFEYPLDRKRYGALVCCFVDIPTEAYLANCIGKLFSAYCGGPHTVPDRYMHWLDEGMGIYAAIRFHGSNHLYRVTDMKYDGHSGVDDKNADTAYKLVCKEMVEGVIEHKSFSQLCRTDLNDLDYKDLAKSWSVISFLADEHLEKLRLFLREFRNVERQGDETPEQLWERHIDRKLAKVFGWKAAELDRAWAEYVKANY